MAVQKTKQKYQQTRGHAQHKWKNGAQGATQHFSCVNRLICPVAARCASSSLLHHLLPRCGQVCMVGTGGPAAGARLYPPYLAPLTTGVPGESHPHQQSSRLWLGSGSPQHSGFSPTQYLTCLNSSQQSEGYKNLHREGTSSIE